METFLDKLKDYYETTVYFACIKIGIPERFIDLSTEGWGHHMHATFSGDLSSMNFKDTVDDAVANIKIDYENQE